MNISYTICDKCAASMPEGSGAAVLKYTDDKKFYPQMHLCDKCFQEVFAGSEPIKKLKQESEACA